MPLRTLTRGRAISCAVIAVIGGFCGFAASAARATALSCVAPSWRAHLESVTSSDPAVDHKTFWPAKAVVTEGTLFATGTVTAAGMVNRVETHP